MALVSNLCVLDVKQNQVYVYIYIGQEWLLCLICVSWMLSKTRYMCTYISIGDRNGSCVQSACAGC
jgi:hypothetical protein